MFPGLKCPTKVKSGQTRKYILVGTVSLTVMLMSCLTYPSKGTLALWLHSSACCFSLSPSLPFQASAWIGSCLVLHICRFNPFLQIPTNQASRWLLQQPTKDVEHIKHKVLVAVFKINPQSGNCITNGPFLQQSPSPCWPFTLRLH